MWCMWGAQGRIKVEAARIGGATYCPMGRLRIIHLRLGTMSGLKSNIAPSMKVPAAEMLQPPYETTRKVPSRNSENGDATLRSRILVHSYSTSLKCRPASQYDHD